jgi:phospholipid-transporting ATPase
MILINSSEGKGSCYIETKNLDGETNLKLRHTSKGVLKTRNSIGLDGLDKFNGKIESEQPNNNIHKFEGNMSIIDNKKNGLNSDNIVLRGCSLRNTDYVEGIVIFTGHDTKLMQNSAKAKYKFSQLELYANLCIGVILTLQMILAIIGSLISTTLSVNYDTSLSWVTEEGKTDSSEMKTLVFQLIGTWILLLNNFVPISLIVQMELVKFWQAMFMTYEVDMYDVRADLKTSMLDETDMPMQASASNLVEELGMVEYVFSDKTGTLTQNIMEFRKFTAGERSFGLAQRPTTEQLPNVNFYDPSLEAV